MSWKNDQVSKAETTKILSLAREALAVEGDFVEFGCYAGDTSLLLAEVLHGRVTAAEGDPHGALATWGRTAAGRTRPELYLYDSFEGLPAKSTEDESVLGQNFVAGALTVTKRDVKARFLRAGLPVPIIKKAWFSDLTDEDLPAKIAFAFLDGDFYDSIKDSLKLITPHLSPGATIVIHDYNNPALPGVAKATDEWLMTHHHETTTFETMLIISV